MRYGRQPCRRLTCEVGLKNRKIRRISPHSRLLDIQNIGIIGANTTQHFAAMASLISAFNAKIRANPWASYVCSTRMYPAALAPASIIEVPARARLHSARNC